MTKHETTPLLSVLIPAYDFPEGVARILTALVYQADENVEILISDDSSTNQVAESVAPFLSRCQQLRYLRNTPALGASANWNALVAQAKGEYCLLLHHDDVPASPGFLRSIILEIAELRSPDVLILDCVLANNATGRNALNAPRCVRAWVARHAPTYLLFRNLIGPPSVMVARREIYPIFDGNLKWLIDVDAYVRLFAGARRIVFTKAARIACVPNRKGSITACLGTEVYDLRCRELLYLRARYPHNGALTVFTEQTVMAQMIRHVEQALWVTFRIGMLALSAVSAQPVASRRMLQRLRAGLSWADGGK